MSDVLIRMAADDDVDAIRALIQAAYAPWVKVISDLPDVSAGIEDDIAAGRVWVAVDAAMIVGTLIGGLFGEQWHVANVAVAPDHGGKGVGRALMNFAVVRAKHDGAPEMALATHRDMPGNVTLYERLGWRVVGQDGTKIMMHRSTGG